MMPEDAPPEEAEFMRQMGIIEVPEKVFYLARFFRWNDVTINLLGNLFEAEER